MNKQFEHLYTKQDSFSANNLELIKNYIIMIIFFALIHLINNNRM